MTQARGKHINPNRHNSVMIDAYASSMWFLRKLSGGIFSPIQNAFKSVFEGVNYAIGGFAIGTVLPFAATLLKDNVEAEWAQNIGNGLLKHTGGVHMGGGEYRWGRWLDHALHTGKWFGIAGTGISFTKHTVADAAAAHANAAPEDKNAAMGAQVLGSVVGAGLVIAGVSEYGDDVLKAVGLDEAFENNIAPIGRSVVEDGESLVRDVRRGVTGLFQ